MQCRFNDSLRPHQTAQKQYRHHCRHKKDFLKNTPQTWSQNKLLCGNTSNWKTTESQDPNYVMLFEEQQLGQSSLMYHVERPHPATRSGTQQPTIPTVLAKRKSTWDEEREKGSTQRICNVATKDMMPISTADNLSEKLNEVMASDRASNRLLTTRWNKVSPNCPSGVNWASVSCLVHTLQLAVSNGSAGITKQAAHSSLLSM